MSLSASTIAPSDVGSSGVPTQLDIVLSNGITLVWDGKSDSGNFVQNGEYLVEVQSGTGAGAVLVQEVSVQDRGSTAGAGVVTAWPNILSASNGTMVTTFHTDSSFTLTLNASIYTIAGELVHAIKGSQGSNQVTWNAAGLASGIYLAVVEEIDPSGGLLSRQILKIAVIK
jgi:flagellar hook assembly protein FlgD